MGGSKSKEDLAMEEKQMPLPDDLELTKQVKKAVLKAKFRKKELRELWKLFKKMDIGGQGVVDSDQFCNYCNINMDSFFEGLWEILDRDQDGVLSFGEMLLGFYKFLLATPSELLELTFQVFDRDGDGYLEDDELEEFREVSFGEYSIYPLSTQTLLKLCDRKRDGKIDFLEFEEASQNYPMVVWRVYDVKDSIETALGGAPFWFNIYGRLHPEYIDQHYTDWKERNAKRRKEAKIMTRMIFGSIVRYVCCFCPCLFQKEEDISIKIDPKNRKNKVGDDVFPDAATLEKRLNYEVDDEYASSDEEIMADYVKELTAKDHGGRRT